MNKILEKVGHCEYCGNFAIRRIRIAASYGPDRQLKDEGAAEEAISKAQQAWFNLPLYHKKCEKEVY